MSGTATLSPNRPFLGVESSATGKRWRSREVDERTALALAQRLELPEIIGRVLAARGIDADTAESFLNPTLREQLPDPSQVKDMGVAVDRIVAALNAGETIGVFGDYDVDGATSAALLVRFFAALGREVLVYVPDRQKEGYGPNLAALLNLKEAGATLVITVDCGTTAFEALEGAAAEGLDMIVIDHHVGEPELPGDAIVVNPNRLDETPGLGQLAAVGVTFLLVVALNRALRDAFWYGEGHAEPDLLDWLDLVALGTVCDVVPLTGVNRALVTQGLTVMARRGNTGIAALADVTGVDRRLDAYYAGFVLGPRVNAGGRVGESGLGVRLLSTRDDAEAQRVAQALDGYNRERQAIEATVQEAAMIQAGEQADAGNALILAVGEGWHSGVIGIVAGRLRERFDRPACVVGIEGDLAKGSGRSVPGVELGPAVIAARQAGIIVNGGGHKMAAGFTVEASRIEDLGFFLTDHIRRQTGGNLPMPGLSIDGTLTPEAGSVELVAALERVGPFGAGNPRPRFAFPDIWVVKADVVGNDHVRCILAGPGGQGRIKGIAFRAADTGLGRALLQSGGLSLHVVGTLRSDDWQGRVGTQLFIEDAAPVRSS